VEWTAIALIGVLLAIYLRSELKRIETRICGADDDEHDRAVEEEVRKASRSYREHLQKLERERKELPQIDPFEISSNRDWQQQLMAKAENLRHLVEEAYGSTPDTPYVSREAYKMPMSYDLAHALASFALLRKDVAIKSTEWRIKKVELLGLMRKRQAKLDTIAELDHDLQEIQQDLEDLEGGIPRAERQVWEAFNARPRNTP
jgi:hypothetical protein